MITKWKIWLNHSLARMTLWPETLWPRHFGQNDTLARVTFWPETLWPETVWLERQFGQCHFVWWHFGQWHLGHSDNFGQWHLGQSDTLASFSCFLWGTKGWIKIPCRGTIGKNLKKKLTLFFWKVMIIFFKFFSMAPPWNFFSPFGTPKEARKTG